MLPLRMYLHGVVMLFAFTFTLAQGIAMIRVFPGTRSCVRVAHAVFNSLSLVFGIAGLILIVSYKSDFEVSDRLSIPRPSKV